MRIPEVVRRAARQAAKVPPTAIVVIGWGLGLVYAFPGLTTIDSLDQLREARAGFYTDGHPPAMAALWRLVDAIVPGPFGMLVLQTGAFVLGTYAILRHALQPRRAALVTALLFVFPPVLSPMAVIWKDCVMAGFLVLGAAALLEERRWLKIAGLACFALATSVRYNTPAATLPLIVLLFAWPGVTHWRRYALAIAAWLGVTTLALGVDTMLTDQKMYVWQSSLALLDIAGTLSNVDGTIPDAELRATLAGTNILVDHDIHAAIRRQYAECRDRGMDFEPLMARDGHLWDVPIVGTTPAPPAQRDAIARAFWDVVTAHPGAYLVHRIATMREVLGLGAHRVGAMVVTYRSDYVDYMHQLGLATTAGAVQQWLQRRSLHFAKTTPAFQPWIYVVLAVVLLLLCRHQRDTLALLLSGLGFESSLFLLAPTPDYRYSHWLVTCTLIAIALSTARRARGEI